jgi:hypothetical protein
VAPNGEVLAKRWNLKEAIRFDRNLYWNPNGKLRFLEWSWEQWRQMGQDPHSLVADPRFVDLDRRDFRLEAGSPAFQIGFEPIETNEIGLVGEREWVDAAKRVSTAEFHRMAPPPADEIDDDFESTPVGDKAAPKAQTEGETKALSIRVNDKTAAGGLRSLKFSDGPSEKKHWPYISYKLNGSNRNSRAAFDLNMDKDAALWHEWREKGAVANALGPSLHFSNGKVTANGKTVARYPFDQWVHVEIDCAVAGANEPLFALILRAPGQPEQRVDGLLFGSKKNLQGFEWIGWMGYGVKPAAFYLDNLRFEAEASRP